MSRQLCPIAVLAYNEEKSITRCLQSIYEAGPGLDLQIHVLANGCTDKTEEIVAEYAKSHSEVIMHSIKFGDRSNAWNIYVYDIAPAAGIHIFIDGDCCASSNAVSMLYASLENNSYANAAAAVPMSGRNKNHYRNELLKYQEFHGNLYALRGSFLESLREKGIKIPIHYCGDDGLLGALVKFNLNLHEDRFWDNKRIIVCSEAGFYFDSLNPLSHRDWGKFFNRKVTYSIRNINTKLIQNAFKKYGFVELPNHIRDFYIRYYDLYRFEYKGLNTFFNWLATRKIERMIKCGRF
jgi:glycosyltransferase involved in cell wall biosynthesis